MTLSSFARVGGISLAMVAAGFAAPWNGSGPLAIRATFAGAATGNFEPILSIGQAGAGDVVFFRQLPDGKFCFGWEQTETGVVLSEPVAAPGAGEHEIMISLGSLLPADELGAELTPLREIALVQLDGRTVLMTKGKFSPAQGGRAVMGKNFVGGAIASGNFSGHIGSTSTVELPRAMAAATESRSLLASKSNDPQEESEFPGPVRIKLMFPMHLTGRNEPIVVTGKTGRGDFIYVRYVDDQHIRIGLDHWLVGGPLSEPIECDYGLPHELTISMGSLLPPLDPAKPDSPTIGRLRTHGLVQLDGKTIIACTSAFHPTKPEQINLGANRIGGSTAEPLFYGEILRAERVAPEQIVAALAEVK